MLPQQQQQQRSRNNISLFSELSYKLSKTPNPAASSLAFQTIELDAADLESFVVQVLSHEVPDTPFLRKLNHQARQLSLHAQSNQDNNLCTFQEQQKCPHCSPAQLGEIILSLQSVIQSTPSLSASMTAQVHSMIGLLRQKKGNLKGAIRSFIKVLWIQTSLSLGNDESEDNNNNSYRNNTNGATLWKMGVTRHRLGRAYGRSGDFVDAIALLERAVQDYQNYFDANHEGHHSFTGTTQSQKDRAIMKEQAQADLERFTEARMLEQARHARRYLRRSSTSSIGTRPVVVTAITAGARLAPCLRRSSTAG